MKKDVDKEFQMMIDNIALIVKCLNPNNDPKIKQEMINAVGFPEEYIKQLCTKENNK